MLGGGAGQRIKDPKTVLIHCFHAGPMLEPCWHYFSLLGVSWACFVALAAFVVTPGRFFGILGRSRLDFGGFRVGLGRVLELLTTYFSMFLLHASLQCKKTPDV